MAGGGVDPLGKSQVNVGGVGNGGSIGGNSMAVHSRGDEAFMDRSASAALDAHRVGCGSHSPLYAVAHLQVRS
jgi:hypothetical protein